MSIKSVYRFSLIMASLLLISGCMTYRYIPGESNAASTSESSSLPVTLLVQPPQLNSKSPYLSDAEWQKIQPVLESTASGELDTWSAANAPVRSPTLTYNVENDTAKTNWGSFFLYIVTLSLVPASYEVGFESEMTVEANGQTLFRSESQGALRRYLSVYFPTPLFIGKTDPSHASKEMSQSMLTSHRSELGKWVATEKQTYDQEIAGKDILEQRQWLIDNPSSLFAGDILGNLASHTPRRDTLGWHQENVSLFPGYLAFLSEEDALWFVGPDGQRVIDLVDAVKRGTSQSILAAQVETQGPYKVFSDEEIRRLRKSGLSNDLIAAMIRSNAQQSAPASSVASTARTSPQDNVAALLIPDNSGEYMNPWTSDGVLAEWVDKAINAKMGSAIGSAAGAYAAQKALDNVPFVGGFLGSKVGKKVGHSAAISASGGMEYIRETSDQSFRNLDDMARYLNAVHANNGNFQDAVKAADAIYPGLMQSLASTQ
ncbi:hypothetical protein Y017_07455 [Alcanivorax sp. 97CO-5]|jgi:hypothetical protein|uniref:hypothetical protein n=1 Tax=Alcanivorax TaxID=59753 RepID=UPI0003E7FF9B|nr:MULTISPECIES: hypothetical protein [unclassified Alcanivorax]EUC71081.1 hypothetical protein Y017_07455 [Alcanivorax sp. 97CO-5]PKG02339.1 hypothetical protein Y019_03275 [Alcanivorax sp. 97CO-6]